jgi:hypothetical protein
MKANEENQDCNIFSCRIHRRPHWKQEGSIYIIHFSAVTFSTDIVGNENHQFSAVTFNKCLTWNKRHQSILDPVNLSRSVAIYNTFKSRCHSLTVLHSTIKISVMNEKLQWSQNRMNSLSVMFNTSSTLCNQNWWTQVQ